jgi:hypothetical protein
MYLALNQFKLAIAAGADIAFIRKSDATAKCSPQQRVIFRTRKRLICTDQLNGVSCM